MALEMHELYYFFSEDDLFAKGLVVTVHQVCIWVELLCNDQVCFSRSTSNLNGDF